MTTESLTERPKFVLGKRLGPVLQISMPDSPHCEICDRLVNCGPLHQPWIDAGVPIRCFQCGGYWAAGSEDRWPEWRFKLTQSVEGVGMARYMSDEAFDAFWNDTESLP